MRRNDPMMEQDPASSGQSQNAAGSPINRLTPPALKSFGVSEELQRVLSLGMKLHIFSPEQLDLFDTIIPGVHASEYNRQVPYLSERARGLGKPIGWLPTDFNERKSALEKLERELDFKELHMTLNKVLTRMAPERLTDLAAIIITFEHHNQRARQELAIFVENVMLDFAVTEEAPKNRIMTPETRDRLKSLPAGTERRREEEQVTFRRLFDPSTIDKEHLDWDRIDLPHFGRKSLRHAS